MICINILFRFGTGEDKGDRSDEEVEGDDDNYDIAFNKVNLLLPGRKFIREGNETMIYNCIFCFYIMYFISCY